MAERMDGLALGEPFFVIQVFDREGYYTSCVGLTQEVVQRAASLHFAKMFVACSLPFLGRWANGLADVTLPFDFKEALATVNHQGDE